MKMMKPVLFWAAFMLPMFFSKANIVILNGLTHHYTVEKGQVYKGKIAVENTSAKSQHIKLFLQDFTYSVDGTTSYTAPNSSQRTNASWIQLNTNYVTLKGKEKAEVYYEITVPASAGGDGSYWSVIMVEPVEDPLPGQNTTGISISSVVRYAIQIITDYRTENAKPELRFEGVKIEKKNGNSIIMVAIANNGNLYCKPIVSIEMYHKKNGERAGQFSTLPMGLLPQTSKLFYIDAGKVPPDRYSAVLLATDENDNAFALNVELDIKND
ncbi:hypothetical protein [uncultured Chryseobacterium sp.]|uniref:hypothetical protein n=1 Tax=uncultured Chryseobacterium sp. TaxID=259322 RepID=UPI003748739E